MKLPRDVSSTELINKLTKLGYITTRQKGSHIKLQEIMNLVYIISLFQITIR